MFTNFKRDKLEDRIIGCLVGGAIGDALGLPVEGRSFKDIQDKYGQVESYLDMKDLPRGTYSDDTQLTLLIAESIVESEGISINDICARLVKWLDNPISAGGSCLGAARALKEGISWRETGSDSDGVGAAMRAAPLGIFFRNDLNSLRKHTIETSSITHRGKGAVASALAVAYSVAYLVNGCYTTAEQFLDEVAGFTGKFLQEMANKVLDPNKVNSYGGPSIVSAALYYFTASPDDFEKSVLRAANSGGDTDSVAGITGNLSGAYNGLRKIPRKFIEDLENGRGGNGEKGKNYIVTVGKNLFRATAK